MRHNSLSNQIASIRWAFQGNDHRVEMVRDLVAQVELLRKEMDTLAGELAALDDTMVELCKHGTAGTPVWQKWWWVKQQLMNWREKL